MYNSAKLDGELKAAGLPILGCASDGRIDWPAGHPTPAEQATAAAVLASHNAGTPTAVDQQLIDLAQSAVGVRVDQLTAAQVRGLLALALRRIGAVGPDLKVRPLLGWFGRDE